MTKVLPTNISIAAVLSAAVLAVSTVTPYSIAPGFLLVDQAVAKNGNGGGGNGDNNGNGNAGGNGNGNAGSNGRGASQSAEKGGNGVGQSGKTGGNLFESLFGKANGKKTTSVAATPAANPKANPNGKTKPKDLMAMGLHPSDLKGGWMGVLMANPNGNFSSSIRSVHGKAREWMQAAGVAAYLAGVAAEANDEANALSDLADALEALAAYEAAVEGLDPVLDADAITAAEVALDDALPDGVTREDAEAAIMEGETAADAEARIRAEAESLAADAAAAQMAADDAQMKSEELFEAVTKGKTPYDETTADLVEQTLLGKDGWQELVDDAVAEAAAEL